MQIAVVKIIKPTQKLGKARVWIELQVAEEENNSISSEQWVFDRNPAYTTMEILALLEQYIPSSSKNY